MLLLCSDIILSGSPIDLLLLAHIVKGLAYLSGNFMYGIVVQLIKIKIHLKLNDSKQHTLEYIFQVC